MGTSHLITLKTIFIHIGLHKTGTTAIQHALANSSTSVLYPLAGRSDHGRLARAHHDLARSVVRRYAERHMVPLSTEPWLCLCREIDSTNCTTIALSSELFWMASIEEIDQINKYLRGYNTHAIVYVRNQWDFMISSYKQAIKMGKTSQSFGRYMRDRLWMMDYGNHIDKWSAVFPTKVRSYDKARSNLLSDFSELVGCPIYDLPMRTNVSPSDSLTKLIAKLNHANNLSLFGIKPVATRLRHKILKNGPINRTAALISKAFVRTPIGTSADKQWFSDMLRSATKAFMTKYIPTEDWCYFQLPDNMPSRDAHLHSTSIWL